MANRHDAAGAALGYLYQTQWPLVELVRRARERPDVELRLELLDDVEWMADGLPKDLVQLKHHLRSTGGVGDMSVDLWRTIAVWLDSGPPGDPDGPSLTLVTTAVVAVDTAAWFLRPDHHDPPQAQALLDAAAHGSTSNDTKSWRARYLDLTAEQRQVFVARIQVLDGAPVIGDLDAELRKELRFALPLGHEDLFVGLVWDWWFRAAVGLLQREMPSVSGLSLAAAIDDLRDRFGDDNLPTLVPREAFDDGSVGNYSTRVFVRQMEFVGAPDLILRKAIQDYYRATTQSARWIEDHLVDLPEVARFKDDLKDEWERCFAWECGTLASGASDDDKRDMGRRLLQRCMDATQVQIRPRYNEPFYFRGKLHELADERLVGWHPEYESLLDELMQAVE